MTTSTKSHTPWPLLACLFLVIFGLKAEVVWNYGTDLPMWDQWDAEGVNIYVPWKEHHLQLVDFLRSHNEHRVVLTRLLSLGELMLNGQWDARLQCLVNAGIHALVGVILFAFGSRWTDGVWRTGLFILTGLACGLPLAWQNVLSGFHSQQYLLLLLSIATIHELLGQEAGRPRWWLGVASAFLAIFTMGSGFFASVVVLGVIIGVSGLNRRYDRTHTPTVLVALAAVAAGLALNVVVPQNAVYRAHSVSEFIRYISNYLASPTRNAGYALVIWAPFALSLGLVLRRWRPAARPEPQVLVLGLAAWVLLQELATAFARGSGGGYPASRYLDVACLGLLLNAMLLGWLNRQEGRLTPRWRLIGAVCWVTTVSIGVASEALDVYRDKLPTYRRYVRDCERTMHDYLHDGEYRTLSSNPIPYPDSLEFHGRAKLRILQDILPASVRRPVALGMAGASEGVVEQSGQVSAAYRTGSPLAPDTGPTKGGDARPVVGRTWSFGGANAARFKSNEFMHERWHILRIPIMGAAEKEEPRFRFSDPALEIPYLTVPLPRRAAAGAAVRYVDYFVYGDTMVMEVEGGSAQVRLALGEPVEIGPFSYLALCLAPLGKPIWILALAAGVLMSMLAIGRPAGCRTG